ncbi:MAG: HD domain-containing protein [Clostridia bacterium]|nr:HD domain-containing protein [Clostridia bacterium]
MRDVSAAIIGAVKTEAQRSYAVHRALSRISLTTDRDAMLNEASEIFRTLYPGDHAWIFLLQGDELVVHRYVVGQAGEPAGVDRVGLSAPGIVPLVAREGRTIVVPHADRDPRVRQVVPGETIRSEIAVPLTVGGRVIGVLNLESARPARYGDEDRLLLESAALHLAAALASQETQARLEKTIIDVISALSAMVETKDDYTEGHCQRIAEMSLAVGLRMNLSEERQRRLLQAAILHDVGKVAVPDAILKKPGPLTPEEWAVMKGHCAAGRRLLETVEMLRPVAEIVEQHHERFDGTGYPLGLAGDEILLEARIISVVDAYDAMTSTRPYRRALPKDEAVRRLLQGAGSQFDPEVVQVFLEGVLGWRT